MGGIEPSATGPGILFSTGASLVVIGASLVDPEALFTAREPGAPESVDKAFGGAEAMIGLLFCKSSLD